MSAPILTDELSAAICELVRRGVPAPQAGESLGVSRRVVNDWIQRGEGRGRADRPGSESYVQFVTDVRQARAQRMVDLIGRLDVMDKKGPHAITWELERQWPDEFGERKALDVNMHATTDGNPPLSFHQFKAALMSAEELAEDDARSADEPPSEPPSDDD